MALYEGEDLVSVQTPDGRTIQLPQSLVPASMMPQVSAAPQPSVLPTVAPPIVPSTPQPPPQEVASPTLPAPEAPSPVVVEEGDPEVTPVTVMEPEVITASPKRMAAAQKQQAAYAASPKGKMDTAQAQQASADDSMAGAIVDQATVDSVASDMVADAYVTRNKELDKIYADRAAAAQQQMLAEEKKMTEIAGLRKKIAGTKIDRKADHPILAALSIALAGFGSALNGQNVSENPALAVFWQSVDRKVNAQMADLDLMAQTYGMSKDELAALKEKGKSNLELYNILIAGETDKATRHLEEIAATTQSDKIKANARVMIAQLQQRAADKSMEAMRWGLDYDFKERAEKNQQGRFYDGLRQQDRHHRDDIQIRREGMLLDWQKAMAADRARGDEAALKMKMELIKDNETRGIRNVVTKQPLLTGKGMQMMDEAAKLEQQASQVEKDAELGLGGVPTPDVTAKAQQQAQAMRQQAAILRGNAELTEHVRGRTSELSDKLSRQHTAAQNITTLVDEIKQAAERKYASVDGKRAAVQAKVQLLKLSLKEATQAGAWDKGLDTLMTSILGGDPTEGLDPEILAAKVTGGLLGTEADAFKERLDAVVSDMQNTVYLNMNGTNFGGTKEELFFRRKPAESTPEAQAVSVLNQERTPTEREAAARASGDSTIAKIGRAGYRGLIDATVPSHADEATAAANSGSMGHVNLSPKQGAAFDTLFKSYKSGNARSGDLLVAQVVNNADSRPELALATLRNLQQFAPDTLYQQARAALPSKSKVAEQISAEEKQRISVAEIPTDMLVQQVTAARAAGADDKEGLAELARRAPGYETPDGRKVPPDPLAVRAVRDIMFKGSLPAGSVFGGRR